MGQTTGVVDERADTSYDPKEPLSPDERGYDMVEELEIGSEGTVSGWKWSMSDGRGGEGASTKTQQRRDRL